MLLISGFVSCLQTRNQHVVGDTRARARAPPPSFLPSVLLYSLPATQLTLGSSRRHAGTRRAALRFPRGPQPTRDASQPTGVDSPLVEPCDTNGGP